MKAEGVARRTVRLGESEPAQRDSVTDLDNMLGLGLGNGVKG
jgi:hypothetical protein